MKGNTNEKSSAVRTSIYIDGALVQKAVILYGEAGVGTFSQFVRKAVEAYIDRLILGNHSPELTASIRRALADEVKPIGVRLSKSLYRYAVELDMLTQLLSYLELPWDAMPEIRREANVRVAKMRGRIRIEDLLQEEHEKHPPLDGGDDDDGPGDVMDWGFEQGLST